MDMLDEIKGVDAKSGRNRRGQTKAHIAAAFGDADLLREEIANGADLMAKDNAGLTPLMTAAIARSGACVDALVQSPMHGAREADHDGWTALMHAAINNELGLVEKIMPSSNSQAVNSNGQKASDVARDSGFPGLSDKMEAMARDQFKRDMARLSARSAERQARLPSKEEPMGR